MTDIFFSYSSKDRDRVRPIHEALEKLGFDVFWDQQVPAGTDWDSWIKDQLKRCRAAIVFWSGTSVSSNNVRQEATIASNEGKLVQVMFDLLRPEQFPMGLYSSQAMDFSTWQGDTTDAKWALLMRELEVKVTPRWIMQRVMAVEANLKSERQKREAAEAREQALETQVSREIDEQRGLRQARDEARRESERARGEAQRAAGGSEVGEAALSEVQQRLSEAERARGAAEAKLAARPMRTPRWLWWAAPVVVAGAIGVGVVVASLDVTRLPLALSTSQTISTGSSSNSDCSKIYTQEKCNIVRKCIWDHTDSDCKKIGDGQ